MSSAAVPTDPVPLRARHRPKSPAFTLFGLLLLILAIAGFWPQYFSVVIGRTPDPRTQFWLIHLHAAIFVAWMLAYVFQATLVLTGRAKVHLKTGPWLAGFGFAAAAVGLFAASRLAARFGERMRDFDAGASFVFFPLIDMVFFAGFLAVAVAYRKRPEIHKRAMLLATYSVAVVGWGRFVFHFADENPVVWQPLILAPLLLAIVYDFAARRKIYGLMVAGLAAHLLRLNAEGFTRTEWWLPLGRGLVAPFG